MKKTISFMAAMVLATLVFIATSFEILGDKDERAAPLGDGADAIMDHAFYCSMVQYWENDAAKGIEPEHRIGWPPFRGPCK